MIETLVVGIERHLSASLAWMAWNLLLALMPWALAVWVFREGRPIGKPSLVLAVMCIAFLPNAAYLLTDIVHLPRHVRAEPSDAIVLVGVIPLFGGFMAVGFAVYLDTVRRIAAWVCSVGWTGRTWPIAISLHAASTVAIYLGRVHRFNSWDLALRPGEVASAVLSAFTRPLPITGMCITFLILVVGHATTRAAIHGLARDIAAFRAASHG